MNHMIHIAAVSQIRLDTDGRAYYRRKLAAGKTTLEALRCLKRRISDALYRQLVAERHRRRGQGELREPVGAARVLRAVEPFLGVEVEDPPLTLGRRPEQAIPELVLADAAGRDHADAGDCDAPAFHDDPDRYFEVMSW